MEENKNAGEREKGTLNRRNVLNGIGTGLVATTGLGVSSGSALGSDDERGVVIEELSDADTKRALETARQGSEFDLLADYYEQNGFVVAFDEASAFEVDRTDADPYRVLNVPARSDASAVTRAGITVVLNDDSSKFEGTWVVNEENTVDKIVTVSVSDGTVDVTQAPTFDSTAGNETVVTPRDPWLPDIDCAACKEVAKVVCEKGCDLSVGTVCKFVTGILATKMCKDLAKALCDGLEGATNACDNGASYVCNEVVNYC